MEEPQYVLSATSLAIIGGVIGVLTGAVSFLTRQLLKAKNNQIEELKQSALHTEDALQRDRDYWRNQALRLLEVHPAERALLIQRDDVDRAELAERLEGRLEERREELR